MQRLIGLVEALGRPDVVLVGDFMLDRWVYGDSERLSQEAPVPVLKVTGEETRTGGAGNVAAGIAALGAKVSCVGFVGNDDEGRQLRELLAAAGPDPSPLIALDDRATIVKTRYVGLAQHKNPQQMLRVDREVTEPLASDVQERINSSFRELVASIPVVALQDHNKGLLTDTTTPEIIAAARSADCKVVVDPALIGDYGRYRGATLLTPNRYEASLASGIDIEDSLSLQQAGRKILEQTCAESVMITLDKDGIFVLRGDGADRRLPPQSRSVYDGTGAGDAVLAAVTVALGDAWDLVDAADLANIVGGLEVERFGVVPITREEVLEELHRIMGSRNEKIMLREGLAEEIQRRKNRGETVVFTNGCFDLLHMGHARFLQQARKLGSCLIVGINSDDSVRRLKGPDRPVLSQNERAEMLASLECVDYVTVFDEDTEIPLLKALKPDLFVKGGATPVVVGKDAAEDIGTKVMTLDLVEGISTTEIINRIISRNDRS